MRLTLTINVSDTLYSLAQALSDCADNALRPEEYIAIALSPGCIKEAEQILAKALHKRFQAVTDILQVD